MDHRNLSLNSISTPPDKPVSRWIKPAIGYLVTLACLIWVFYDVDLNQFLQSMTTIKWWWVVPAIAFDILSYLCQGLRWRFLLRPIGNVSSLRTTQAIYAGLFTNEVLPMRFGELVRAYLVSQWVSAELVSVIPSMVVERLLDGMWLALAIGLIAIFVPLPRDLIKAANILGIIVLIATGLFIYVVFRNQATLTDHVSGKFSGWKPIRLLISFIRRLTTGLRGIGMSRFFYVSFGVSLFILIFQALAFWLVMRAYGLELSFWIGAAVFLIVHFGTAIPNAPANIGTYQFFCVVGLTLFGVEKTMATGFSVVVFILLTIPLWVIGFFALSSSGMTLYAIRNEINTLLWKAKTEIKD